MASNIYKDTYISTTQGQVIERIPSPIMETESTEVSEEMNGPFCKSAVAHQKFSDSITFLTPVTLCTPNAL